MKVSLKHGQEEQDWFIVKVTFVQYLGKHFPTIKQAGILMENLKFIHLSYLMSALMRCF